MGWLDERVEAKRGGKINDIAARLKHKKLNNKMLGAFYLFIF